jgi:protein-S-isoprenylcysteine O-methyltransferase Ste14
MTMNNEVLFRLLYTIAAIFMFAIRIYYQSRIKSVQSGTQERGSRLHLIPGAIAALVTIVFGFEYIFAPGTFEFAYLIDYPTWLRWVGALMLAIGISLLWSAHHSLGMSFHSLVVQKEDQELVKSGPYKWIRHPIYTAYFFNYIGGGLLASNWVLTFIPVLCFGLMVHLRLGEEEAAMIEMFGDDYRQYMDRTGKFLPKIGRSGIAN